ncbi:MAG TPA: class I SAM-dependent methyltransferase [Anaerolineae bacterium]|nr:class I SAM-dependent methyltransferase [Anaerolineae bacterium]
MQYVACNLCGSTATRPRFPSTIPDDTLPRGPETFRCTHSGYGRHYAIVQCVQCGLVYTNPRLNGQAILDSYIAVEDPLYLRERDGRVLTFERHLRPLEKIKSPPGRLLDVGAYTGVFVEIACRHGWEAGGLEPSQWAVSEARKRNLPMIEGTLDSVDLPEAAYDVITLWDVIEHVTDPFVEIQRAYRLLKPGGLLVLHTMDIDSLFARLMGPRWPWLMEMHLYYFSHRTLRAMLEKAGLRVIRATPQGRYLRLGYFATRVGGLLGPPAGRVLGGLFGLLHLRQAPIPINLGDLFTAYAMKP